MNALNQKRWKDRVIMKGEEYKFPVREFDIFKMKKEELI